jgi:hypothetical protein
VKKPPSTKNPRRQLPDIFYHRQPNELLSLHRQSRARRAEGSKRSDVRFGSGAEVLPCPRPRPLAAKSGHRQIALYLVVYYAGIPVLRTVVWGVSIVGLAMMVMAMPPAPWPM